MSVTIRIDQDVYEILKAKAEPFVDTPNAVLRRLLGMTAPQGLPAHAARRRAPSKKRLRATKSEPRKPTKASAPRAAREVRAASGTILPEDSYELPILRALIAAGGSASPRQVVKRVGRILANDLTAVDKESLGSGGIRWESRVQFVRLRLIDGGLMDRNAPRGTWVISEEGRRFVADAES